MIKIERIKPGTKAVFMRDGIEHTVFLGQLLSWGEFESLQFTSGGVTISIDETEVQELTAPEALSTVPAAAPAAVSTKPTVAPAAASTKPTVAPVAASAKPTVASTKPTVTK